MEINFIAVSVVSFAVGMGVGIAAALGLMHYSIIKALSYGEDWVFMGEDFMISRIKS